jgi:GT2 family glycosyltransferase
VVHEIPLISILLLSIDRYDMLVKTLEHNLANIGHPYELLVCDNGSKDQRVIEYLKSKNPACLRLNEENEGCGKAFNQLYLRAFGTHIALMSNDFLWPDGWGKWMVAWLDLIKNPGLCGIKFRDDHMHPPLSKRGEQEAHFVSREFGHDHSRIFGPTMFKRELVEKVGLFCEDFGPYGLEDSDLNERVTLAGLNSFYVPVLRSKHLEEDVGQDTEYRKAKDASLKANDVIFNKRRTWRDNGGSCVEPLPEPRDPIKKDQI